MDVRPQKKVLFNRLHRSMILIANNCKEKIIMNPVSLLLLSSFENDQLFVRYEKQLSLRTDDLKFDYGEIIGIKGVVEGLKKEFSNSERNKIYDVLEGFYYAFKIPQIGKEFDLLRIGSKTVINIELKRQVPKGGIEAILEQLKKNKYYLLSLKKDVKLFTYVLEDNTLYYMNHNEILQITSFLELKMELMMQKELYNEDINKLFKVSEYLISPLNTPEKFLRGEYFLNNNQSEIKNKILHSMRYNETASYGLTGGPGTGKTLLLYDIARDLCKHGNCLIIHCGILSKGHQVLNDSIDNLIIMSAKESKQIENFDRYQFILVDEAHRMHRNQFNSLVQVRNYLPNIKMLFSYDTNQTLSIIEIECNIAERINDLPSITVFRLTDKIRTNPEISSFIRRLFDQKSHDIKPSYPSIDLLEADTEEQTIELIKLYQNRGYTFIRFTESNRHTSLYDNINKITARDFDTHHVIGQEFDKVIMVIGDNFVYSSNRELLCSQHPNPDYIYLKLLFQGLTRTREKLALVIWNNKKLFEAALSIVHSS